MGFSYTPEQIATKMEQEGCGGCAEEFLIAATAEDSHKAYTIIRQSIEHIEAEGYNDDLAVACIEALQLWLAEASQL